MPPSGSTSKGRQEINYNKCLRIPTGSSRRHVWSKHYIIKLYNLGFDSSAQLMVSSNHHCDQLPGNTCKLLCHYFVILCALVVQCRLSPFNTSTLKVVAAQIQYLCCPCQSCCWFSSDVEYCCCQRQWETSIITTCYLYDCGTPSPFPSSLNMWTLNMIEIISNHLQ